MMDYGDEQDPAGRIAAANERLRDYAHKATCTITELAGGGSELFASKIGDMYTADLPFCRERVRSREQRAHERALRAVSTQRDQKATIDALVAALEAAQKTNSAILTEGGLKIDKWWDGLVAAQQGIAAALALARGGK